MTSSRPHLLAVGVAIAIAAAAVADQGAETQAALFGVALGAVVALVADHSLTARTTGFLAGVAAAWLGFALRAAVLPDIPMGRALAATTVIVVITVIAVATKNRVPLWSGLIGAAAMIGAYETTFAANPTAFVTDSTTAATTVLVAAAVGLLIASLVDAVHRNHPTEILEETATLDELMLPAPRASVDADVEQEVQR